MIIPYKAISDWLLAVTCEWNKTSYLSLSLSLASHPIPSEIVSIFPKELWFVEKENFQK